MNNDFWSITYIKLLYGYLKYTAHIVWSTFNILYGKEQSTFVFAGNTGLEWHARLS